MATTGRASVSHPRPRVSGEPHDEEIERGRAELARAATRLRRISVLLGPAALVLVALVSLPALLFANTLTDGSARYWINAVTLGVLSVPAVVVATRIGMHDQERTAALMDSLERKLTSALAEAAAEAASSADVTERQQFASRVANALEMAADEDEVLSVVERAFATVLPASGAELLLADNSQAHLDRVTANDGAASCPVESPDKCPAARRGQVQRFDDSEQLDACPKLRNRPGGPCSALCVPVSIGGRAAGVIHAAAERGAPLPESSDAKLGTLANLVGSRLGLLRAMAESQLQAETDALTGLMNRRSLENRARALRAAGTSFAVVMADLDRFKDLNDAHGHETGDRTLRTFAESLRRGVRSDDLVSRHGGEEFVVLMPGCTVAAATERLRRVQKELIDASRLAGLPSVTASFGVVASLPGEDLATSLSRADIALFEAKEKGRDRIVAHGTGVLDLAEPA